MREEEKPWTPLTVDEVTRLFANASFPWWIAGGYALELAVAKSIRSHSDIDVLVLRRDHLAARALLKAWDCWAADPPGTLRKWPEGEELASTVHDVWCRETQDDPWRIQLMIDESDGNDWVSRRNRQIRAPLEDITRTTSTGVRYIAPHIQLFYKAKNVREKDEIDFDAVVTEGVDMDVPWLRRAILKCHGDQHPWLNRLFA